MSGDRLLEAKSSAVVYHDKLAAGWDGRYRSGGFRRRAQFFAERVLPEMSSAAVWLDAGCGSGFFTRLVAGQGASVVGVDASDAMIAEATGLAKAAGLAEKLSFQVVDTVEALPFGDGSFGGAICLSVVEYLAQPEKCVSELARVTEKGGQIIFSVPNQRSVLRLGQAAYRRSWWAPAGGSTDYLDVSVFASTPKRIAALVNDCGIAVEHTVCFDPLIPSALYAILSPSLMYVIGRKVG